MIFNCSMSLVLYKFIDLGGFHRHKSPQFLDNEVHYHDWQS